METKNIVLAMQTELSLTEQDLIELEKDKAGLILDPTTDSGWKASKKERQERNKITGNIDRISIDGKKAIDDVRQQLKERVESAYLGIIQPLEIEEAERKRIAQEKKEKEQERIDAIHSRINAMYNFIDEADGLDIDGISGLIEAVDLIDCADNFDEFAGDALNVQKKILTELNNKLATAINENNLKKQREEMAIKQKELDARQQEMEEKRASMDKRYKEMLAREKEFEKALQKPEPEPEMMPVEEPEETPEQKPEGKKNEKFLNDYDTGFIDGIKSTFKTQMSMNEHIEAYLNSI